VWRALPDVDREFRRLVVHVFDKAKRNSRGALVALLMGGLILGGLAPSSSGATKRKCVPTKTKRCPSTTTTKPKRGAATTTIATTTTTIATTTTVAPTTIPPTTAPASSTTTTAVAGASTPIPIPSAGADVAAWQVYFRQIFPPDATVITSSQATVDCAGKPLILRGDGLSVASTNCSPVMIDGNRNTLTIDLLNPGGTIVGDQNFLLFRGGAANGLRIAGNNNTVRPA
jgi:hypothetical protein